MAKLTILIPLIALILFAAYASARPHQEDEEQSMCERELEDVNLKHCERHIMQQIQEDEEDEENFLRMRGSKNHHEWRRGNNKRRCCNELRELEEERAECMCEALQQIMESQGDKLQSKHQLKAMEKELRNLPRTCGLRSTPRRCDLSSHQS